MATVRFRGVDEFRTHGGRIAVHGRHILAQSAQNRGETRITVVGGVEGIFAVSLGDALRHHTTGVHTAVGMKEPKTG